MGTPSTDIGPGIGAFLAFFALAVTLWLLMRNMNARMRRMAYRERERMEVLEAQRLAEPATRPRTPEPDPDPEASPNPEPGADPDPEPGAGGPGRAGAG